MSLFTRNETIRIFGILILVFFVMISYAIARPATESLFLEAHGSGALPAVWLAVALASVLTVLFYNRYSTRVDLVRLFGLASGISAGTLSLILVARQAEIPGATFILYVWKDVYIIILVEIFWSFANSIFPVKAARWSYGLFLFVGSIGGFIGNMGSGYLAKIIGTENNLWLVVPLLLMGWVGTYFLARIAKPEQKEEDQKVPATFKDSLDLLLKSRYLLMILALIATVQLVITLVDYQYNIMLEAAYSDTDARTAVIGQIYAAIDVASISLQLLSGPLLRFVGIPLTLLAVPILLGSVLGALVLIPQFMVMAATKVMSKSLDYSIFRAAKEILYIPLTYTEKTQGKAFIDMLTYRVAKGAVSLLLMALVAINAGPSAVIVLTLGLIVVWIVITVSLARAYRVKVPKG